MDEGPGRGLRPFADPRPEMMTMRVTRGIQVTFSRNFMMRLGWVIKAEKEIKTRTSARENPAPSRRTFSKSVLRLRVFTPAVFVVNPHLPTPQRSNFNPPETIEDAVSSCRRHYSLQTKI